MTIARGKEGIVCFGSQSLPTVLGTVEWGPSSQFLPIVLGTVELRPSIMVAGACGRDHLLVVDKRQRGRPGTRASPQNVLPVTFLQLASTSHKFPKLLKTALSTGDQAFSNEPGGVSHSIARTVLHFRV